MKQLRAGEKTCPFCEELNDRVIEKSAHNAVIPNLFAYQYWEFMHVTEHLMIVPLRHIESLSDLTDKEKIDTINLIAKYEAKGYNIYAREKDNAIKSVPHQHTHLIKTKNKRAKLLFYMKKPYILWRR